jgi:hypothetical protein
LDSISPPTPQAVHLRLSRSMERKLIAAGGDGWLCVVCRLTGASSRS